MKRVKKIGAGINFPVQLLAWCNNMPVKTEIHVGLTKEGLTHTFQGEFTNIKELFPFLRSLW